jgi:hypothetical protein
LRAALVITLLGLAVRCLAWPCAPDTWDGVGFVEAVTSFDLASFRPHPPGYPLFVAVARVVHAVGVPPLHAVVAASLLLSALAPLAGFAIVSRVVEGDGRFAALFTAALLAFCPGLVVSSVATMSDGPALGLALVAYACALDRRRHAPLLTGLAVAAAMGVRPSGPLVVAPALLLLFARHRIGGVLRGALAACAGVLAWLVPTALVIGPRRWLDLTRAQLAGHLAHFGESDAVWTQGRSASHAFFESIALQLFGVEGRAGFALGLVVVIAVAIAAFDVAVRLRRRALLVALAVPIPFSIAIAATQPIAAAPRHALPITAAVVIVLGLVVAYVPRLVARIVSAATVAAAVVMGVVAARVHRLPPPAVALLRHVAHDPSLARATVVGGRSSRFSPFGEGARIVPGELAGDAVIYATRAEPFPDPLLITSEIDPRGVPAERLHTLATFSRSSPLDRRESTLVLLRLDLRPPR